MSAKEGVLFLVDEPASSPKTPPVITQVLGRVEAPGATLEGTPKGNSTRWLVDVECAPGEDVEIRLLDFRSGRRVYPDLMSYPITPLDADCYDARPFVVEGDGKVTIRTRRLLPGVIIHYRIQIDTIYSANR